MIEMKLFVVDKGEGKKCGGCNEECSIFYGAGEDKKEAVNNFDEPDEGYGKGICAQCMCDFLIDEKGEIFG